jgi:hypothetical protein
MMAQITHKTPSGNGVTIKLLNIIKKTAKSIIFDL